MSDTPKQSNYDEYWTYPTFSALGQEQGYIVEEKIVTVEDLLVRFSGFEPFELALGINNKIISGYEILPLLRRNSYGGLMIDASHCRVHPHAAGAVGGNQDMSRTKSHASCHSAQKES